MTDTWTCTDCDLDIQQEDRKQHMKDEHGAQFGIPEHICPVCKTVPCKRIGEMMG